MFEFLGAIMMIIIWKGSPEVNVSVLIGSYLVGIFMPYKRFHGNSPRLYIFFVKASKFEMGFSLA